MFAVTEMQPSPLCAKVASATPSSPDRIEKLGPQARRVLSGRCRSPVASLTPTMRGSLARRAIVSTDMSITQRGGML